MQVKFSLVNHFIKKNKHAVFTTVLCEMQVLQAPVNVIQSLVKKCCHTGETSSKKATKQAHTDSAW